MDDTVTTPETKSTTISTSKMMGREVSGGSNRSGLGGKESKIGKLSRILRTTRIKVNDIEVKTKDHDKRIKINAEKITRIKKIIKAQKSDLAEKLSSLDQTAEFASVEKGLDEIIKTLQKERKAEKKAAEAARKKKERDRAKSREKKLESGLGKGIKKVVGTVVKPFKSIFDKIFGFLLNVLIGRTVIKLIDWFGDKENQKKIKSLIRFIKDWWPALTAAVLIFGTGFGSLAGGLVSIIGGFIPKFLALSVKLAAAVAKNPFAIGAGLFAAGAVVPALFPQTVEDDADKQANKAAEEKGSAQAAEDLKNQKGGFFDFLMGGGQERKEQAQKLETGKEKRYGFFGELNSGGQVPGRGPNKDTIPAMLTPGEFVMSRGAVDKFGTDTLSSMNAMGGGTNNPKVTSGVTYANGGGSVRGSGAGSPEEGYPSKSNSVARGASAFVNRFVMGDDSLLNKLAQGDTGGALKTLGIKIDNNTEATNRNTAGMGGGFVKDRIGDAKNITSMGGNFVDGLKNKRKEISEFIKNTPYFGETAAIERERKLGLMEPGADSLLPEVREKLKSNDERIRNLYDPEKDTGFMGGLKKINQTMQNKGAIADPFAALGLKNEGTEKFVEKITGGRVKNLGAKITGLQFAAKGLLGPLGKMFQIDDKGSLGRYLRPAMEEAQRQGHGAVGAKALGQKKYDELVPDRLANLALGQTAFTVGKDGRAKTSDTYDSNNTSEYYFKTSREALSEGNVGPALFNGLSGLLRVNQNTGWGNLRPGGNDIDLGGGFAPTDSSEKSKMSGAQLKNAQAYAKSKGKYFSSKDGNTYASYQDALDAQKVKPAQISKSQPKINPTITPPVKPEPKVNLMELFAAPELPPAEPNGRNNIPPFSPTTAGSKQKTDLLGLLTGF